MSQVHPADDGLILRSARAVVCLSALAIILLGIAEQGGVGSQLSPVPQRPLPYDRSGVFGIDLTGLGSAAALAWLESARPESFELAYLPVDSDIVGALAASDTQEDALTALDRLILAAGEVPIAVCLEHPLSPVDDPTLAEIVVDTLRDRYASAVAYISDCRASETGNWLEALVAQLPGQNLPAEKALLPLATGAPVVVEPIATINELRTSNLRSFSGADFVAPRLPVTQPLSGGDIQLAVSALQNAAQIGLVLLQPGPELDPVALSSSIDGSRLAGDVLPEGFSNAGSPAVRLSGDWQAARVGTVEYRRAGAGAVIEATFVGTTIYLMGLLSPGAGTISVWIDDAEPFAAAPDTIVDLTATQARDGAIVLSDDLAAAEHTLRLVTRDGEVTISGLFVSGEPESGWSAGLATLTLILAGSAALALVGYGRVRRIRRRTGPQTDDDEGGYHPREFTRAARD